MAEEKIQQIIDQIKGLTLLEASELVKAMETTFGVSAAAAAVAAAPAGAGGSGSGSRGEDRVQRCSDWRLARTRSTSSRSSARSPASD